MFIVIVLLFVLLLILAGVLTAWTLWFQAYLYTEVSAGVPWRGPAAGGAVVFFVMLWVVCDYQAPGRYRPFWESASTETHPPYPELRIPGANGEDVYKLDRAAWNNGKGKVRYLLNGQPGKELPTRPRKVIVADGDERVEFVPDMEGGKFKQNSRSSWFAGKSSETLLYRDAKGRSMEESSLGRLSSVRGSWFIGNVLLNALLLVVAFLAFWLLLRFQWPHALVQALVVWLVLLFFVLPPLLTRVEGVAKQRSEAQAAAEKAEKK